MTHVPRFCHHRITRLGAIVSLWVTAFPSLTSAQIAGDGLVGTQVNGSVLAPCVSTCVITGGTERGATLYHSLREFSIPTNGSAWFNNLPHIQTILTRVTGNAISNIDGVIKANGTASLFLLNPNGIIFGPHTQLQMGGSFWASTANSFQFADGSEFSATQPQAPPLLTINVPIGLQWGPHPASITNAGHLSVGQNLALLGGTVISTGNLDASNGNLLVSAVAGDAQVRQAQALQATLVASHDLRLPESQLHTIGDLALLAGNTVWIHDSLTTPVQVQAGRNLTILGQQGIDILALNHPGAAFQSGGDLRLISDGIISGDAHFASNGEFSVLNLQGQPGQFISLYDPIISVNGDAILGNYTGTSLKVEATGNIEIGNVVITNFDVGLTGSDPDIPILTSQSALILRSGVSQLTNPANFVPNQQYSILNLGTLGGNYSEARNINNLGQVVGDSMDVAGTGRAFRTAPNAAINPLTDNLDTLGRNYSYASDINDLGQVVVVAFGPDVESFRTAPNVAINLLTDNLGTLDIGAIALGINSIGQVVGNSLDGSFNRGFRTAPNAAINPFTDNLGTLGGNVSVASDINNLGQVVGYSLDAAGNLRAFRTTPNAAINLLTDDLGTLVGNNSNATSINNLGQVVGSSSDAAGNGHAFRTAPNAAINPLTDSLGTLGGVYSTALDINNLGQVVGSSSDATGNSRAFLYDNGFLIDLNSRIPSNSGWILTNAAAINDNGQIAGNGLVAGQERAVLLTPLPAVSSVGSGTLTVGSISQSVGDPLTVILAAKSDVQVGTISTNGGNATVTSETGTVNLTGFLDATALSADGGAITVSAPGTITTRGMDSGSFGAGQGGPITLTSTRGSIQATDTLRTDSALGAAGDLRLTAAGNITTQSLFSFSFGDQKGGDIHIASGETFRATNARINSGTVGNGSAGTISIQASSVDLLTGSAVVAGTAGNGAGGGVSLNVSDRLTLAGVDSSGNPSEITTNTLGSGRGGDIQVSARTLVMQDGAVIAATAQNGTGTGGNINVDGDTISLQGTTPDGTLPSRIVTSSFGAGDAGDLTIDTRQLIVQAGALISTASISPNPGAGRSGNLTINASNSITLRGTSATGQILSALSTDTFGSGRAGALRLNTRRLSVQDGAAVSVSTFGSAPGGQMIVNAHDFIDLGGTAPNGFASGLYAQAFGSGNAGDLQVTTQRLTVHDRATITVASGSAADTRVPTGQANFSLPVNAGSPGNAGILTINANTLRLDRQGKLLASTASGAGGNIQLKISDLLVLRHHSLISATAGTAQSGGNGGNITINTPFVIGVLPENSDITANAFTGRGGNINITTNGIFGLRFQPQLTPKSDITASSQFGINGTVTLNLLSLDPSQGLVALPVDVVDPASQIRARCAGGANSSSSFTETGRGGVPASPDEPLRDAAVVVNWILPQEAVEPTTQLPLKQTNVIEEVAPPVQLVEAQGWVMDSDGSVYLVAQVPNRLSRVNQYVPVGCMNQPNPEHH